MMLSIANIDAGCCYAHHHLYRVSLFIVMLGVALQGVIMLSYALLNVMAPFKGSVYTSYFAVWF
jgi:hypothetical protein